MSARPSRLSVIRDTSAYLGGWLLMLKEAGILFDPPAQANETLIWVAALLIGVPGVAQVIAWRFGIGAGPSSHPGLDSSEPSESSSSTTGGDPV